METSPTPNGKALCGLLAFLFFQKLFLDVPVLSSPGWDWHTQVTWKPGHTPWKQAASSQCLELPSFGPRAVPRPWEQTGPSKWDLRVSATVSKMVCLSLKSLPIFS